MDELIQIIKEFDGKRSFICKQLGITLKDLDKLCEGNPEIAEAFDLIQNEETIFNEDLFDTQLKFGLVMGGPWALNHIAKQKNLGELASKANLVVNISDLDAGVL